MLILIHLWIQIKRTKRIFLSNYSLNCQLPSKVKSIQPFPTDNNTCYRISRHNWFSFTLSALWRLLTHMVHLRHFKLLSSSSSTSSPWWWSCCPPGWCSGCTICSALLSSTSTTARGWASTCVQAENAGFSLFTGMLSMQKFASSNFGTTWPLYAMNQKCYYDWPKIIVIDSKHLK